MCVNILRTCLLIQVSFITVSTVCIIYVHMCIRMFGPLQIRQDIEYHGIRIYPTAYAVEDEDDAAANSKIDVSGLYCTACVCMHVCVRVCVCACVLVCAYVCVCALCI